MTHLFFRILQINISYFFESIISFITYQGTTQRLTYTRKYLSIVTCWWKGKTEYKYFNFITIVTETYLSIVQ